MGRMMGDTTANALAMVKMSMSMPSCGVGRGGAGMGHIFIEEWFDSHMAHMGGNARWPGQVK